MGFFSSGLENQSRTSDRKRGQELVTYIDSQAGLNKIGPYVIRVTSAIIELRILIYVATRSETNNIIWKYSVFGFQFIPKMVRRHHCKQRTEVLTETYFQTRNYSVIWAGFRMDSAIQPAIMILPNKDRPVISPNLGIGERGEIRQDSRIRTEIKVKLRKSK
jgi:hypothetical protein